MVDREVKALGITSLFCVYEQFQKGGCKSLGRAAGHIAQIVSETSGALQTRGQPKCVHRDGLRPVSWCLLWSKHTIYSKFTSTVTLELRIFEGPVDRLNIEAMAAIKITEVRGRPHIPDSNT